MGRERFRISVTYADYFLMKQALQHEVERETDVARRDRMRHLIHQINNRIAYNRAKFSGSLEKNECGRMETFDEFVQRNRNR